ncbi:DUF4259 domain-containing protein [Microbacterium sp. cx-59]|uniref:DUF4259 domain-containing protein n=1 Tax=Microbacterium sp. cx-59 TaxID=2891207 RepID=UPI001E636EB3|nr:DUF4259 domain-containing protein [Microbacterium sp. cx-59]MCC4908605.1 DUF4259 domain-containing protein [Microbacterium sp. cx-59]
MGAWSGEPFGNDAAADWASELDSLTDWGAVRAALTAAAGVPDLDADAASCAIAAAETVAHGIGKPTQNDAYTDSVHSFVERAGRPDDMLVALAISGLAAATSAGSELTELWEEDDPEEWRIANEALRDALERA